MNEEKWRLPPLQGEGWDGLSADKIIEERYPDHEGEEDRFRPRGRPCAGGLKSTCGKRPSNPESKDEVPGPTEGRQALHELQVHQIELEMQNEELRRTQAELEASRARYFDLYDLAPVGYFTLSEEGLILEANLTAATLLGVARGALVKQPITRFILPEDQDIYYRHRKLLFETGSPQACELRLMKKDAAPFWVHIDSILAQGHRRCASLPRHDDRHHRTQAERGRGSPHRTDREADQLHLEHRRGV